MWHVRKILAELFQIDNKTNLFKLDLPSPNEKHMDDSPLDPSPPSDSRSGTSDPSSGQGGTNSHLSRDQTEVNKSIVCTSESGEFQANKETPLNADINEHIVPVEVSSDNVMKLKQSRNIS